MSKKHKRAKAKTRKAASAPTENVVWHQSAEEATLAKKPHYNGFACGHGAHGSAKYDRNKQKRDLRKQLESSRYDKKGASRGSFRIYGGYAQYIQCRSPLSSLYDRVI